MNVTIRFDVDWIKNQTDFNHAFNEVFFICEEDDTKLSDDALELKNKLKTIVRCLNKGAE